MEITNYNKKRLQELIDSPFYAQLDYVPISYLRAASQIANPYADENDILLWVIYTDKQLVGYLGALPDRFKLNQKELKIYWLSCLWIAPGYRGKDIKDKLLQAAIDFYGYSIAITNVLYFLERPYQRLGIFQATQNNFGKSFYINPQFSDLIFAKYPKIKAIKPLYDTLESTLTKLLKIRKLFYKKQQHDIHLEENFQIDEELTDFLDHFSTQSKDIVRKKEHFEWIAKHPWMRVGEADSESKKYYFSSIAKSFNYFGFKLYDNEKFSAFCLVKERDKNVSTCYIDAGKKDKPMLAEYILDWAINQNYNTIFSMDKIISRHLEKKKRNFILIREVRRPYLLPKEMDISSGKFQFRDSDVEFT